MSPFTLIAWLLELFLLVLIARALLSWFQTPRGSVLDKINQALAVVTEPVLAPLRKVIPPIQVGGTYLDLSILVLFLVIQIVLIPLFS